MTPEDAEVARMVRREMAKRPLDSRQVDVQVKAGKVTLSGRVLHNRDDRAVSLRAEIEILHKSVTRDRLVKGFFDQLQYVVDHGDADDKEKNSRGRMRS